MFRPFLTIIGYISQQHTWKSMTRWRPSFTVNTSKYTVNVYVTAIKIHVVIFSIFVTVQSSV